MLFSLLVVAQDLLFVNLKMFQNKNMACNKKTLQQMPFLLNGQVLKSLNLAFDHKECASVKPVIARKSLILGFFCTRLLLRRDATAWTSVLSLVFSRTTLIDSESPSSCLFPPARDIDTHEPWRLEGFMSLCHLLQCSATFTSLYLILGKLSELQLLTD